MNTKEFFRRPSAIAFLAFTGLYAACMAFIFWGTWALDKAPVEPDNAIFYPIDDAARWFAALCAGGDFVPSDLMRVLGGMYFWQELQYALAAYLAALGVVFYLRGRCVPLVGAYGGGAAYGLMGYCFTLFSAGHLGWFIWLMYGPFAFGLVDRCVRKGKWRNWALLGVVLAWAGARQSDMWLLFTVLTFAYGVWCIVRGWRGRAQSGELRWGRLFAGVGVCAAVVLLTGAPQFGRALVHDLAGRDKQIAASSGASASADGKADVSREKRWEFCTSWSLPPEDTLEFVAAEVHGGSNDPRVSPKDPYRGRLGQQIVVPPGQGGRHPVTGEIVKPGDRIWIPYRQHSLYFGFLTIIFAAVGVVGWWNRRNADALATSHQPLTTKHQAPSTKHQASPSYSDVPFWAISAIVVYLCALGCFTPFYRLVFAMPFGDYLRAPVKFVHLLELCVAVLAGYGLAWAHERFGAARAWVGTVLCVLAALNVIDLARVDSKYLAVEDVSFQKAPNDAAEDVVKAGGGKVFVAMLPQDGGRLVRDSMGAHLAETVEDQAAEGVRFVLASGKTLRADEALNERWRRGELVPVGFYSLTRQGIRKAAQNAAALVLMQAKNVPAPTDDKPPADRMAQAMTLVSVLMTLGVGAWAAYGCLGCCVRRKTE
jgi:hypothetical protein